MTGWRGPCEVATGIENRLGHPLIIKCGQPGELYDSVPFGVVLCPEHKNRKDEIVAQWKRASEALEKARLARRHAREAS